MADGLDVQFTDTVATVAAKDNPPTPDLHPPPVSDDFKKEIQSTETDEATGKRAAGHDESSSLPATSVATGEQGRFSPRQGVLGLRTGLTTRSREGNQDRG